MKFVELKNDLQKKIRPAYLITGNDRYLCYASLEAIIKSLNLQFADLNHVVMEGANLAPETIAESASVFPFMDEYRFVQVNGYSSKPKSKEDFLLKYLQNPLKQSVIVFFNPDGADGLKQYLSSVEVVDCDKLSLETLNQFLRAKAEKENIKIQAKAIETLILFCNNDMARISGEMEKLSCFANGKEIDVQMVRDLVVEDKEYQIFSLAEFIAQGDKEKAFDLVQTLSNDKRGGFSILTPLYNNYRRVLYKSINKDKTDAELASLLSVKEYAIKMIKNQVRVFTPKKLKTIVDMLYNFDRNIKMGKIKEDVALKTAVLNILKIRG